MSVSKENIEECSEPLYAHRDVLTNVFCHKDFKTKQWEAIASVISEKRDCVVNAHAGYGKSLIYQFPPVYLDKIALIISPLIGLINDQVFYLKDKNVKVCILDYLDSNELISKYNIVYVTPEYYGTDNCKVRLEELRDNLCLVAVDEAHCIARYGSDYLESYKNLEQLKTTFPEIPLIALTSTAIPKVQAYIVELLQMVNPLTIETPLDRTNLRYTREIMSNPLHDICPYITNLDGGSTIIYCMDYFGCDRVACMLTSQDFVCRIYSKDTNREDNKQTIKEFRNNKLKIVVATNAFGMGIDKPDVRLIIHYGFPHSIENYYQESGRAGRDGKRAQCVLFYGNSTLSDYREILKSTKREMRTHKKKLIMKMQESLLGYECLRMRILRHFDPQVQKLPNREQCCGLCYFHIKNCVALHMRYEGLDKNQCYDFTDDARLLLMALRDTRKLCSIDEIINLLVGTQPTANERKVFYTAMQHYGLGKVRPNEWWSLLYYELVKLQYCKNTSIAQKGRLFLSSASNTMKIRFNERFLKYLKRKPIEYQILSKQLITIHHTSLNDNFFLPPIMPHKLVDDGWIRFEHIYATDLRYIGEAFIQESDGQDTDDEETWDDLGDLCESD